jgi:phospholipid-binding lipoprotein MlaA
MGFIKQKLGKDIMFKSLSFYLLLILMTGCASTGANKDDPWEDWNRSVYQFNKVIDNSIAKPITKGYKAITPDIVETGVSNVFSNINDVPTMINSLLQGKVINSFSDLGRFVINSTVGVGGLWDPATSIGLVKHDEDFGQTLGAWGVESGPYMMLPFLGASTLRDTAAYPVNSETDLLNQIEHIPTRNQTKVLELIDKRSGYLEYDDLLKDAIDEYIFIRDAYLQNRKYKVLDGNLPFEEECEDEEEDCDF